MKTGSGTARQRIEEALRAGPATARDLSGRLGITEREVLGHLPHLERSLRARGERLVTEPSRCLECGFAFRKRTRLTRPSHCAVCRSARLTLPVFQLGGG